MVTQCMHYKFNQTKFTDSNQDSITETSEPYCHGSYEQCAKEVTCRSEPGQVVKCFSVWHQTNHSSTPVTISAGCHQYDPGHSNQCDTQCIGQPRGSNYYCCCTANVCNKQEYLKLPQVTATSNSAPNEAAQLLGTLSVTINALASVISVFLIVLAVFASLYLYKMYKRDKRMKSNCNGRCSNNRIDLDGSRSLANNLDARELNELGNRGDVSVMVPFRTDPHPTTAIDPYFNNNNHDNGEHQDTKLIPQTKHPSSDANNSCLISKATSIDLSNIELSDIVGSGRFGTVHKAMWSFNGEDSEIAVKVMQANDQQSWLNELQIYGLPNMKHRNISSFLGANEHVETGNYWLVVEYASKGSLYSYLKENIVNWNDFLQIALGIAHGLSHLHDTDIAHRDFKSKNVLLRADLSPCITDFGVAVLLDTSLGGSHSDQKKKYLQVGTPRYMAPEVLECSVTFTKASFTKIDVYALSLVLWEILSRCHPLPNVTKRPTYAALNNNHPVSRGNHHQYTYSPANIAKNSTYDHGNGCLPPTQYQDMLPLTAPMSQQVADVFQASGPPPYQVPFDQAPEPPPYRVPFEEVAGPNPNINTMRQIVVIEKLRPILKSEWRLYPTSELCRAIEDGWEYDHDARISASCFIERVESLLQRLNH